MRYQDTATYRAVRDLYDKVFRISEKHAEKLIEDLANGQFLCPHCHIQIDLKKSAPLSLVNCPKCNELLFIPMEIERWWLTEPLAAGGYGSVYVGRAKSNAGEKVTVKVLQRTEDIGPRDEEAFLWECEVGHEIGVHPNLVKILKFGVWKNVPYMVMEHIDGERLSEYVSSTRGKLPIEECLYYLFDLVGGLEHILARGYLHRDIKPENVVINRDGMAILVDYGSCLPEEVTKKVAPGPVIGSPHFVSPERYMRMSEDVRSDIYSLGMLGFYALEGHHFSLGETLTTVKQTHTRSIRLRLSDKMSLDDPEMIDMIDRMTRRNPDERLRSYDEVRQYILFILAKYHQKAAKDHRIAARRKHFLSTHGKIAREEG